MREKLTEKRLQPLSHMDLVKAGSDIALLLSNKGTVLDVAINDDSLAQALKGDWRGKEWIDTVTEESRIKVRELLEEARSGSGPLWRQLNHTTSSSAAGSDRPVRYCTLKINGGKQYLALGRDLQLVADLQQQLILAQEASERDYWQLRQSESRFNLLFQICSDAVMVADSHSERILEVNPRAETLLDPQQIDGRSRVSTLFENDSAIRVRELLNKAAAAGHAEDSMLALKKSGTTIHLSASMLRQGNAGVFILIMMPSAESSTHDPLTSRLMQVIDAVPDSVVATDARGDILFTNPAFVDLVQLNNASLVEQQPLSNWLGRSPVDINLLLANLRKSGRISSLKSQIRGEHGITEEVEVSGTSITGHDSGELGFGFIIRSAARRLTPPIGNLGTSRSVEQLTELVGSVPLKELVRESADLIERLSIETALRLTGNNRAAAAEMLGLSRQSLYVKLRRHQIDDDLADSD